MENLNKNKIDFDTYKKHVIGFFLCGLMLEERSERHAEYAQSEYVTSEIKNLYDNGVYSYEASDIIEDLFPAWNMDVKKDGLRRVG